jgi:hypothetical protein
MTTLADILRRVEGGVFPAPDLSVTVVPAPSERDTCVLGFTAHIVVAADVDPAWIADQLPPGDLSAPLNPPFLSALEDKTGRRVNAIDLMLLAPALTGTERATAAAGLTPLNAIDHPRVRRAFRYRDEVAAYSDDSAAVVLTGRGIAGRWECAVEVPEHHRGAGTGRRLARAARALLPEGEHLWAQVTPGNAASLRAFLAAGFHPIGSEALLIPNP